jgi:hypothetical protein
VKDSKAAKAFQRKLLIAWCIGQQATNLTGLQKITGMPRRTLQDCIKDLDDVGITCQFHQQNDARNNQGEYRIESWGPIEPNWVNNQIGAIAKSLNINLLPLDDLPAP